MQKLLGKTALITGGTSGIGLATAQIFLQEGARVAVTGRNPDSLIRAQQTLGEHALVINSDTSNLADIDALAAQIGMHFGSLDILFLNAGIAIAGSVEAVSEADFDEQISVNLKGVFFTLQKVLPLLRTGSSVIVTTSIGNRFGTPGSSVYAATKAGLRSMVQALALELIGRGIRVNAVCPGPIDTPMFDRMGLPDEVLKARKGAIADKNPRKRFGTASEVANVVLFLASEDSSYMVGEELVVDGGMSILRPIGA
jgi:NAD(P)-dependent dehydrogenase (short-subunit alcohol dehydrogenase family)